VKLGDEISSYSQKLTQSLQEWFSKEIEHGLITPLNDDVSSLCESLKTLSKAAADLCDNFQANRQALITKYPEKLSNLPFNPSATPS
jgi:hypothetical protein